MIEPLTKEERGEIEKTFAYQYGFVKSGWYSKLYDLDKKLAVEFVNDMEKLWKTYLDDRYK